MNEDTQQNMELTAQEEAFCDLYVHGGMEFAGQILKCYRKIFGAPLSPASVVAGGLPVRGGAVRNSKDAVDKWIWGLGLGI